MFKKRITLECLCDKYSDHETPCCDFFKQILNNCKIRLVYIKKRNMYGIEIISCPGLVQGIRYCPWCGAKFPGIVELGRCLKED